MILIITYKDDFTADYLITKLKSKKIPFRRFNCEDIDSIPHYISDDINFNLDLDGINNFNSVWFRRTKLPEINIQNQSQKHYILEEYDALLNNFFHTIKTNKWLSHPDSVYKAENKMFQLKIAQGIGFKLPKTLVTNDKELLKSFAINNRCDIVIKPLSNSRIIDNKEAKLIFTNKLSKEHLDNIEGFDLTPSIFQEYIEKEYELRVTVIRDKLFATKIDSQINENTKVDWRKEKGVLKEYILPESLSKKCIEIVKALNLSFGAIDLIKSKNGEYYFLEINPNGQWAWIEFETNQNISEEIINYLTSN